MISRVPITVSAPILVGLPVLIVGIWLSGMWNWQSRHAVTELADQNIDQIHDMAATKVADVLSIPERICRLNEHLVQSDALDPADLSSWRPTLAREAQTFDMLSAISWGSEDGRSVWVSRYSDGSFYWAIKDDPSQMRMTEWRLDEQGAIIGEEANEFEFDLFSRPWFLTPREAGEATWSDPFVWVGGVDSDGVTLGISFGVPLQDSSGSNLGVVDADFSLNDLSGFLREMRIGRTGFAVLTTATGEMLAASIDTPIVSNDGELIRTEESPDERIKSAASLPGQLESNSGTHARMDVDGSVHYVRSSPIGQEIGLDWTLLTIIPESDFTARIDSEFQRSWMMSLVAVGLAVLAGLSASRWLVAPLTQLVSAVRSIGKGDLDTRVELRHAPEYTHLANEINAMTLDCRIGCGCGNHCRWPWRFRRICCRPKRPRSGDLILQDTARTATRPAVTTTIIWTCPVSMTMPLSLPSVM